MSFDEVRVDIPTILPRREVVTPQNNQQSEENEQHEVNDFSLHEDIAIENNVEPSQSIVLRRSQRERRSAIPNDYVVYLQESDFDIGIKKDPVLFSQAISSDDSTKWVDAMNDELKSMYQNNVWDLVELPSNCKKIGCKWVFKTKRDAKGNIERFKARLVAKGFTQKEGIDYKETFFQYLRRTHLESFWTL